MTLLPPIASGTPAAKKPKKRRARPPRTWIEIMDDATGAVPASCLDCGMIVQARNYPHGFAADVVPVSRWWLDLIPEPIYWEWRLRQGYARHYATGLRHVCRPYATGREVDGG